LQKSGKLSENLRFWRNLGWICGQDKRAVGDAVYSGNAFHCVELVQEDAEVGLGAKKVEQEFFPPPKTRELNAKSRIFILKLPTTTEANKSKDSATVYWSVLLVWCARLIGCKALNAIN
jgi:hypothetical protein